MKARMPSRFGSSEGELDIDLRFVMRGGEIEKETLHDSATNKTLPDDLERTSFLGFFFLSALTFRFLSYGSEGSNFSAARDYYLGTMSSRTMIIEVRPQTELLLNFKD